MKKRFGRVTKAQSCCFGKPAWEWLTALWLMPAACLAQIAGFTVPDTVCEGQPVPITQVVPASAATWQWNFCSGNVAGIPEGLNIGNTGQYLNAPAFITLVRDSTDYYTFITSTGNARVVCCAFGNSITQYPLTITDLGDFGVLTSDVSGIQVVEENGVWYGFVADSNRLVCLDFGSSPGNTPASRIFTLPGVGGAGGLFLINYTGVWLGFLTDADGNGFLRLEFAAGLANDPTVLAFGNIFGLSQPAGLVVDSEDGQWYAFICNAGNSTISRIRFGSSLLNPAPSGETLATVSWLNTNKGIVFVHDCGTVTGIVTNCIQESDKCVVQLTFPRGMGGPVVGDLVSTEGMLNFPSGITDFVRQGDILHGFVANSGSSSVVRLFFPSCSAASLPFYSGPDPPPILYASPGSYNIMLTVDNGLPTQGSKCRHVVVLPRPDLALGPDRMICRGDSLTLDAGAGREHYLWSTGDTVRTIRVGEAGTYWVKITTSVCEAFDTIEVEVNETASAAVDTIVCNGLSYWVQHAARTTAGTYYDTLQTGAGCDSVVTTRLGFKECATEIWLPTAFTPDGDGLNDVFRALGTEIGRFDLQIFDRWGREIFFSDSLERGWNGMLDGHMADPGVYTYLVHYENRLLPGVVRRRSGTVTLVR